MTILNKILSGFTKFRQNRKLNAATAGVLFLAGIVASLVVGDAKTALLFILTGTMVIFLAYNRGRSFSPQVVRLLVLATVFVLIVGLVAAWLVANMQALIGLALAGGIIIWFTYDHKVD
ncbi:MAG: hypothetical protein LKF36_01025 [Lactobacillus sp.]|jgi:hypothetical protein|nr:hypothetical protein [Lactobacillus sp.]